MAMNTMIFESEGQVFTWFREPWVVNEYIAMRQAGGAALRLTPGEIRIRGKKNLIWIRYAGFERFESGV